MKASRDLSRVVHWEVLAAVTESPLPVGEIARRLDLDKYGVSKSLRILRRYKLVVCTADGNYRLYALNPQNLHLLATGRMEVSFKGADGFEATILIRSPHAVPSIVPGSVLAHIEDIQGKRPTNEAASL